MQFDIQSSRNLSDTGIKVLAPYVPQSYFHFERQRLNTLFIEAIRFPIVMVCAGSGYGKTSSVLNFLQEAKETTAWLQFSKRDNVSARFWESYTRTIAQINEPFAKSLGKLGFPCSKDKLNQYLALLKKIDMVKRHIIVLDDFHCIDNPSVLHFIDCTFSHLPAGTTVIMLSRSIPKINTETLIAKNRLYIIKEDELKFTDNELSEYFTRQGLSLKSDSMRDIMKDTEGWAFAINLIARSYKKAPGYKGYIRKAMKANIFTLMETEVWNNISKSVQCFLVRLSLIDHLAFDLISLLAGDNTDIIGEMEKQNAYLRRDSYINAYVIHPLFLEFLATKQNSLTEEMKLHTYKIAGAWCNDNGFNIDAMSYFEKTGDYASIVSVLLGLPAQIPFDIAKYAAAIFDRAPSEAFNTVESLAIMHIRSYMSQGLWQEALDLAEHYEAKFLSLPEKNPFRKRSLCGLYYYWAYLRGLTCVTHETCDFDVYFEKFCNHITPSFNLENLSNYCTGPWVIITGSSKKGAPQEYIGALRRSAQVISRFFNGLRTGEDDLAQAELAFYQGDIKTAESLIPGVLELARKTQQFELMHRALLYAIRIGIAHGDLKKAEQALNLTKSQLEESQYHNRYINYDISLSWYYCLLGLPEKVIDWLKQDFSEYCHSGFTENLANHVKARYCFITKNNPLLLSYIHDTKHRASIIFGRVEMLAMEACVYYRMKLKQKALIALKKAYDAASPNDILMPFIEMGKDMRTLSSFALKEKKYGIPLPWLEQISRKSATYAKRQSHVIAKYLQANKAAESVILSVQETEVLKNLSQGISRAGIAASCNLSINTVKIVINRIYSKLGAENLPDLIRIAAEKRMI